LAGIIFIDDHNALVPIDLVPELPGRPADGTWQPAYAEMVAKARERGWIDIQTNAIRAHVEREFKRAPTRGAGSRCFPFVLRYSNLALRSFATNPR
jgi:hypothetical protein